MPRIPEPEIERLKAAVSLVALIEAAGYALKRQGKDLAMRCPLHEGDATPSFVVTPSKNVWHCFGCQRGGSVIDWVMASRTVSFRHAVELLAQESPALAAPPARAVRSAAAAFALPAGAEPAAADAALLAQVIAHYQATLRTHAEGLAYLGARGLDHPDLVERFRLGVGNRTLGYLVPEKNRVQGAALRGALQRIGLLRASGHEHFNGSLVIPLVDAAGAVVEAYGRKLRDDLRPGTPKHLYLPGPHRGVFNRADWHGAEELILCESLIDALTFWCAGYRHVTCAFGVAGFTDELLAAFVASGVKRVLIAYDRDAAGDTAAAKLAPILESRGIAPFRVIFPKGMDANEYAVKVGPPAKSLGLVLRQAEAMRAGAVRPVSVAVATPDLPAPVASAPSAALPAAVAPVAATPPAAPVLPLAAAVAPSTAAAAPPARPAPEPASPAPPRPSDVPVEVREHDVVLAFGPRRYRVRGLDKNLAFDVLRVNLLASAADGLHADTFDLYQAKARAAFARQAAVELGVEEAVIQRDLGQVLLQLEALQERQIDAALTPKAAAAPALSEEDHAAALALLRDPALLERIAADVAAIGVVGEGANALIGYLACVSRLLDKPLAILIQSTSAAGKSTLMDALLALMPEAERVHYSAMTGQSLFYLGEQAMKHKILAIAEEEGVRQAAYALKLLQSQGELTIASTGKDPASGQLVTQEYRVEGPVMLFLTTTAIDIDEELLNRCLVLTIDETREQTGAIHQQQRTARTLAGLLAAQRGEAVRRLHRAAQTLLRPLAVVNPYAERLTFRTESTRLRRDHAKYLTLIDAIALLHQHQRPLRYIEHAGRRVEYIEATREDIALANRLAHDVLGRSLDELPPQTRRVLGALDALVRERMAADARVRADVRFTRRDVRTATGMHDTQVRVHLDRLVQLDYVLPHRGQRGQSFVYELLFDGAADSDAAQLIGLLDVATLTAMTDGSRGASAGSRGEGPEVAGPSRPPCGVLAGDSRSGEIPRSASADAGSSSLVAALPETTVLAAAPARRSYRSGNGRAAPDSRP